MRLGNTLSYLEAYMYKERNLREDWMLHFDSIQEGNGKGTPKSFAVRHHGCFFIFYFIGF